MVDVTSAHRFVSCAGLLFLCVSVTLPHGGGGAAMSSASAGKKTGKRSLEDKVLNEARHASSMLGHLLKLKEEATLVDRLRKELSGDDEDGWPKKLHNGDSGITLDSILGKEEDSKKINGDLDLGSLFAAVNRPSGGKKKKSELVSLNTISGLGDVFQSNDPEDIDDSIEKGVSRALKLLQSSGSAGQPKKLKKKNDRPQPDFFKTGDLDLDGLELQLQAVRAASTNRQRGDGKKPSSNAISAAEKQNAKKQMTPAEKMVEECRHACCPLKGGCSNLGQYRCYFDCTYYKS